jgi:GT2 family glycosyltransferase
MLIGGNGVPGVSVIVVNWNTRDHLQGCLESLERSGAMGPDAEVIVVDNASTDGSAAMVRSSWPEVRLIENSENEGFTRANNRAIRASHGRYLLLINSDARMTAGALATMVAWMNERTQAGVVGPRLVYGDGRWQRWTAGQAPSLRAALVHYFFLDRLGVSGSIYLSRDTREPFQPDWVSSACMLVRRAALDEVGLLDERIFVYMDDVDVCERMRRGGWEVWYWPTSTVVHFMSQSTTSEPGGASPGALRSFNAYFAARHGRVSCLALRAIEACGSIIRAGAYAAAATLRHADPFLLAKARAHWAFCRVSLESIPAQHSSTRIHGSNHRGGPSLCVS